MVRPAIFTGCFVTSHIILKLAVDAITGGLYKLSPEQIAGTLLEQHASESDDDGVMLIAVVLEPGIGWSRIGTLARE